MDKETIIAYAQRHPLEMSVALLMTRIDKSQAKRRAEERRLWEAEERRRAEERRLWEAEERRKTIIRMGDCPSCDSKLTRGKRDKKNDYKREWACHTCGESHHI